MMPGKGAIRGRAAVGWGLKQSARQAGAVAWPEGGKRRSFPTPGFAPGNALLPPPGSGGNPSRALLLALISTRQFAARRKTLCWERTLPWLSTVTKGLISLRPAFGNGSLLLAQITFPEEHLVIQVGKGHPGVIHQAHGAYPTGRKVKSGGGCQPPAPAMRTWEDLRRS